LYDNFIGTDTPCTNPCCISARDGGFVNKIGSTKRIDLRREYRFSFELFDGKGLLEIDKISLRH